MNQQKQKQKQKLEELRKKKHNLFQSLEWAIINNDRLFAQTLEVELKTTLKAIKKLERGLDGN